MLMFDALLQDPSWRSGLGGEFLHPYMLELQRFLGAELSADKTVFPRVDEYFAAFNSTPLNKVKVVILGQDPYHGIGQAHGLCFSVQKQIKIPPSLRNIYKELKADLGCEFAHGDLTSWTGQGVLLLNAVLTVEQSRAASHQGKGWEQFTDLAIELVSEQNQNCVFMLWGAYAHKKGRMIDSHKHLVLEAPHPSPLSAHRGFLGCGHFSKCNQYLKDSGQAPIQWMSEELPCQGVMF